MSLKFDGATNGLLLFQRSYGNVLLGANGATVMAWMRPVNASPAATNSVGGVSVGGTGATSVTSRANLELVAGGIRFTVRSADTDGGTAVTSTSLAALSDTWIHVAGTVDYTSKQISIYVNGVLSNTTNATAMTAGAPTTGSISGSIGTALNGTGNFFNGNIEDFRIYNQLWGPNDLANFYTAKGKDGVNRNLVMRFQCNELGIGQTAKAVSINTTQNFAAVNTGTPTYGDTYSSPRKKTRHPTGHNGNGSLDGVSTGLTGIDF